MWYKNINRLLNVVNTKSEDSGRWASLAYWTEVFSAFMLALATLASAYSLWQSAQWGSQQSVLFAEASADRLESSKALSTANAQLSYDASIWVQLELAYWGGHREVLSRIRENMIRDEFQVAVDAWIAMDPLNNRNAPATPLQMEQYTVAAREEALRLEASATAKFEEGKEVNRISDRYVLALVLFALVLFFAGIATKFNALSVRLAALTFSLGVFAAAIIYLLSLPLI